MAVYNNADYLTTQLQSIFDQTYSNFRLIIRDDCSKDNSVAIVEEFSQKYPGKILLIQGTENLGALGNFISLLDYAKGDYVLFSDGDDYWLPTKIEETLAVMLKKEAEYGTETPILIHTNLKVVDRNLKIINESFWDYSKINPQKAKTLNRLLVQNVITGCTMLINKSLVSLATPIPKGVIMHDWWLGLVAAAFGQVDVIPKATILYRQHGKNEVGAKNFNGLSIYLAYVKKISSLEGRNQLRKNLHKTMDQSALFLNKFANHLNSEQLKVVQYYISIKTAGTFQKRNLFFKHRFFKQSLSRNIGMFFLL